METNSEFEQWIEHMKAKGYDVYQDAGCPKCGERAVQMHNDGVVHSRCSSCNWSDSGFGGPNVHSWGEAVRRTYGEEGARIVAREKAAGRY